MSANSNSRNTRWSWLWMSLAALLIGALALAAACGDDDDSGDDDGGDDGSPTATEPADGGDDDGGDDGGDDDDGNGGSGDDAIETLTELANNYETFQGYVQYAVSGDLGTGLASMSIYQDGDNSRFDIDSDEGDVIIINTSDGSYFCSEDQCIKYPAGDDTASAFAEGFTAFVDSDTVEEDFVDPDIDYDISSDNIAGLDATCFTATGDLDDETEGDEVGEVCFSDDGSLLLRISSVSDEGEYKMEATEASTDVPGGSFDPPYEVIDFSELGDFGDLGDLFDN